MIDLMLGYVFWILSCWGKSGSSCLLSVDYLAVLHSFVAVLYWFCHDFLPVCTQ